MKVKGLARARTRDVSFQEGYATLMVKGKTGPRRVVVVVEHVFFKG